MTKFRLGAVEAPWEEAVRGECHACKREITELRGHIDYKVKGG
jgi:hypothetical protein